MDDDVTNEPMQEAPTVEVKAPKKPAKAPAKALTSKTDAARARVLARLAAR
jgi:hypothetical protein